MDISKEVKRMMFEKDCTIIKLAELLNTSQPNLSNKFKRNDFRIKELIQIADVLGYDFRIEFIERK